MTEALTAVPDRYSVPGHDRDCARAMWSQAIIGRNPLSQTQVNHLLRIAWTAGAHAEHDAIYEDIVEDCRQIFDYTKALAQTCRSGNYLIESVVSVYGPTLPWRRRLRLAARLAFRKGYLR